MEQMTPSASSNEPHVPILDLQGQLAERLDQVLKAAPTLKAHPDLAHMVAIHPGDLAENAQNLAGLHFTHQMVKAVHEYVSNFYKENEDAIVQAYLAQRQAETKANNQIAPETNK